ncbi:hypothetical protein J4225_00765 [Candidatus Pacearchaeota archaeon]|nr:hypothetical protein [Candidatus Pacearchaeota archaeon]
MKTVLAIFIFFIFAALLIISNNNLAINNQENMRIFYELYGNWLNQIFFNTQKITGEIVKYPWLPETSG